MSNIPRFLEYAGAFEQAVASDDWSSLEPFFSQDVVYEIGLPLLGLDRCKGRDALFAWFKQVLDGFDRRFDSRVLEPRGMPEEDEDGAVTIRGAAIYRAEGVPDFTLELEETARFEGDRIVHLEDRYSEQMQADAEAFLTRYAGQLGMNVALDAD